MKNNIKDPRFNIGDKVWVIAQNIFDIKGVCGFCGGTGKSVGHDKNEIKCPICEGNGKLVEDIEFKWEIVRKFTVKKLNIITEQKKNKTISSVIYYNKDNAFGENHCFGSKEEAVSACKQLNKACYGVIPPQVPSQINFPRSP